MEEVVNAVLKQASLDQLIGAIQEKLSINEEVKIKAHWSRFQHTAYNNSPRRIRVIDSEADAVIQSFVDTHFGRKRSIS